MDGNTASASAFDHESNHSSSGSNNDSNGNNNNDGTDAMNIDSHNHGVDYERGEASSDHSPPAPASSTAYSLDLPELRKRGVPLREQFNCKKLYLSFFMID
jgi:hypothetical protein